MSRVVVLGAGATKNCNGPLTDEILPKAFEYRDQFQDKDTFNLVENFLVAHFGVPPDLPSDKQRYPGLPLLLSLLDTAIHRNDSFSSNWPVDRLREVREGVEEIVYKLIEFFLMQPERHHDHLIQRLGESPEIISLNYDLLADYAFMNTANWECFPDYGCDVATDYGNGKTKGTLLKIHGSLNWLYCPTCHHLEVGTTASIPRHAPALPNVRCIETEYASGAPCPGIRGGGSCGTRMRRVLITPSHIKDYRNPHIASIWRRAEETLRNADHVVIIGYSLPWDDVEVIYLLQRGLAHLGAAKITVVEYSANANQRAIENHHAGQRYRAVFGEVDWFCEGFEEWLKHG